MKMPLWFSTLLLHKGTETKVIINRARKKSYTQNIFLRTKEEMIMKRYLAISAAVIGLTAATALAQMGGSGGMGGQQQPGGTMGSQQSHQMMGSQMMSQDM